MLDVSRYVCKRLHTDGESDVVEAVEEREPRWLKYICLRRFVPHAKLLVKSVHGLSTRKGLIVKAIIECGDGDQGACEGKPPIKEAKFSEDSHCGNGLEGFTAVLRERIECMARPEDTSAYYRS